MTLPEAPLPAQTTAERRAAARSRLGQRAAAYGLSLLLAVAATLLTRALPGFTSSVVFFFPLTAIIIASWYGGRRAGLVCTIAAAILTHYYVIHPVAAFFPLATMDAVRLVAFILLGTMIGMLSGGLRDAMRRTTEQANELQDQAMELEQQVEESQIIGGQLADANEELAGLTQEAEQARARLAGILSTVTDLFVTYSVEGDDLRFEFMNEAARAAARRIGADPDAMIGRSALDAPTMAASRFPAEAREAIRSGKPREYEEYVPALDAWFAVRLYPSASLLTTVARDVTEQKRSELALRQSERRYRALVEAATEMLWSTDANGMVEDMPHWRELTGQTPGEVRGQGWLDALHPEDREPTGKTWRQALEERRPYESEYRLRMKDGSYRWFRARGVPVLDEGGAVAEWVGTFHDVHERRQQENQRAEQDALVETVHRIGGTLAGELEMGRIVQVVTDAATQITGASFGAFFYNVVNTQGELYTLYTLSGAPREAFENFGHPRPTPVFAPTFYGTAIVRSDDITKDPRYGQMGPHHGMPKGHLPVRSYLAVPVISRSGEVLGGLFFGHVETGRFTERHERIVTGIAGWAAVAMDNARLYEAERSARQEAEAASRAKSEFLAVMSHELRTPLNAIGGYAQLLAMGVRGPVSEAQAADLERIERSQRHLLSLINDILNLARIEAGQVRYDIEDVRVAEALAAIQPLVLPLAEAKGQTLEWLDPSCDAVGRADRDKLHQIVLNLLSNAIKFTAPGGRIAIECEATDAAITIAIIDDGEGIPSDRHETIFEPFVQLDTSLTRTREGTGLGLSISRDLARGMGGTLTVESAVGVGSTFRLTIPRALPNAG